MKPKRIRIETSSICQLKCPSCPTGRGEIKATHAKSGFLKKEDLRSLLRENSWIESLELSNWGEIFLNREICDIFRVAAEHGVRVRASNGVNLNNCDDKALEACVRYGVEHLTCSIDGASQKTYEMYRREGSYNDVIGNIRRLNHFKKRYNSILPNLTWQFIIFGHNEHELPRARKLAEQFGMEFKPKLSWDEKFSPVKGTDRVKKETGFFVTSRSEFMKATGENYMRSVCTQLWSEPQINFDGKVLGCCINTWGDFGNAFDEGLMKVLNGEKISYARKMLLGKAKERDDIPCTTCSKYQELKMHGNWLSQKDLGEEEKNGLFSPAKLLLSNLSKVGRRLYFFVFSR